MQTSKPLHIDMQQNCVANLACLPGLDFTSFFLPQNDPCIYDFNPLDMVGSYNCNGSTTISSMSAGTADNQETCRNDERKKRRLASNRESARRSRVRKQRRLNDLSSQVAELQGTNQRLLIELHHMIAKHARIVRENDKLRDEAADLQKRLNEMEVEEAEAAPETPEVA
ncbi:hypothetical protein BAE44_0025437 [Dichanthelium oligosanthes]|uniref:BZIP domain-containing protein n=1 Tax=Dichanthelium oligosanthes TaxID=888268 RepID=A0A1E5UL09_9POAL|nr:hypothetical protein BAE44_0025437 [Dichanthelium oligosanthes]